MEYIVMVCDNCGKLMSEKDKSDADAYGKRYYIQVVRFRNARTSGGGMTLVRLDLCENCGDERLGQAIENRIAKEGF